MKAIHGVLLCLIALLCIIVGLAIVPPVQYATGFPHPEIKGILISKANIDQQETTKWLGYFFGLAIIGLMGFLISHGSRKQEKPTKLGRYIWIGIMAYVSVYSAMVFSHWSYVSEDGGAFFGGMPIPTAWMIFGVWFVPLIIMFGFIKEFESSVISDKEVADFKSFLQDQKKD
ncbi:MAG: hypothetical protein AAFQ02_01625 [Bacteroidota bacterium]